MMSLCRILLGFPADTDDRGWSTHCRRIGGAVASDVAGLRCIAARIPASPEHVVESAAVGARAPLSFAVSPPPSRKEGEEEAEAEAEGRSVEWIDDGTRGLGYLYGRSGRGGLELCTESLGFESCCDGRMGAEEERAEQEIRRRIEEANRSSPDGQRCDAAMRRKARPARSRTEKKEFPPPLTWMSSGDGGRSMSFMKAVREDGRFLLKEVRIERPEVLRATRKSGRLRLELVNPKPEEVEEEEVMEELEEEVAENAPRKGQEAIAGEDGAPNWPLRARKALDGGGLRSARCQELAREALPSSPFWVPGF